MAEAADCSCEFDACDCNADPECPPGDCPESWHFLRRCRLCGTEWGALHCPHDGVQNGCPSCGWREPGQQTPGELFGIRHDLNNPGGASR